MRIPEIANLQVVAIQPMPIMVKTRPFLKQNTPKTRVSNRILIPKRAIKTTRSSPNEQIRTILLNHVQQAHHQIQCTCRRHATRHAPTKPFPTSIFQRPSIISEIETRSTRNTRVELRYLYLHLHHIRFEKVRFPIIFPTNRPFGCWIMERVRRAAGKLCRYCWNVNWPQKTTSDRVRVRIVLRAKNCVPSRMRRAWCFIKTLFLRREVYLGQFSFRNGISAGFWGPRRYYRMIRGIEADMGVFLLRYSLWSCRKVICCMTGALWGWHLEVWGWEMGWAHNRLRWK
jgi:hypothetical protein